MKFTRLKLSVEQKRKLKKGQQIRISAKNFAMEGEGIALIVHPHKYNALVKSFDDNRGMIFKLDSEELDVNENPDSIDDEEVRDVIIGEGFWRDLGRKSRKAAKKVKRGVKKISKGVKKIGNEIADIGEDVGKEMKGLSKKVLGKKATRALLNMGYELKDIAEEVGEDIIKEVESMGDEVLGPYIEMYKDLEDDVKKVIKNVSHASKLISRNISPDKWENLVKELPRYYRAEMRDGPIGQLLREAIRQGTKYAMESAIKMMYSNPYTAPLAPAAETAYTLYGSQAIEEIVKVSGAGLRAGGDGLSAGGSGLSAGGSGLSAGGSGLSADGSGLSAGGSGLSAGGQIQFQTRPEIPNYIMKKQQGMHISVGSGHKCNPCKHKTYGGRGIDIKGIKSNVATHAVVKPRPLAKISILNKSI